MKDPILQSDEPSGSSLTAARQVRGERLVEKILEAAVEELSQKGYGALSVEDVAARAEVARTTVYRRWPTKADLALDALRRLANEVMQVPDTGSLREDLMVMLKMFREFAWSPRGQSLMRMTMAEGLDAEVAHLARRIREEKAAKPRDVIARAVARGELPRGTDAELVLDMLFGAVQHNCFMHTAITDQRLVQFMDLVLVGATNGGAVSKKSRPKSRARSASNAKK